MATGTTVHPPRELCRYFLSNVCRFGDNCVYSHDRSTGQVNNICRYYLQGKCSYGDRCRYDHIRPKPQISTSSQSKPIISNPVSSQQATVSVMRSQPVNGQTTMSYASVCRGNNDTTDTSNEFEQYPLSHSFQSLCPYAEKDGVCEALETGRYCPYVHGDICDLCQMPSLHPTDEQQREQHRIECMQKHEAECEEAFAIQRSQDKTCGVCLETVWTRDGDKRFGILENCDHIFCLECIRKWRASSNYENKIVKACPECRVKSDFITPAKYWPENDQAKRELINSYKENLQQIHCKFFKRGDGVCPFGSKCFYLHVDKHGQPVQLNPPHRRQRINARGELENFTEILMASVFANEDISRFFDEYDFIFDDEDDEYFDTDDSDENELRFTDEHNQSDNDNDDDDDDDSPSQWH